MTFPSRESVRIAVIGAGLAGLTCARTLRADGLTVTVFEKSRGLGGRMATRRTAEGWSCDHGAQYFTARDEGFRAETAAWIAAGGAARWDGKVRVLRRGSWSETEGAVERFVGTPGMTGIGKHLAQDLDVRTGTRLLPTEREGAGWRLRDDGGNDLGTYDAVISSAPPAQSAELLSAVPGWTEKIAAVPMAPSWAVMVRFKGPTGIPADGAFVQDSPLSWVARDDSKPGRTRGVGETWVLHAGGEWSADHIELGAEAVVEPVLEAFATAIGGSLPGVASALAHRWRYALPTAPLPERCLSDPTLRAATCGDWCGGPRVEGAWLSGRAAGETVASWFR